jgi:hypothetical protein
LAVLGASRLAEAKDRPHQQPQIVSGHVHQQSLQYVLPAAKMRLPDVGHEELWRRANMSGWAENHGIAGQQKN